MIILLREACALLCSDCIWLLLAAKESGTSIDTQTGPRRKPRFSNTRRGLRVLYRQAGGRRRKIRG